jgi:hypothetical protein
VPKYFKNFTELETTLAIGTVAKCQLQLSIPLVVANYFSFCFCVNRCVVLVELTSIKRETGVNCHTRRGKCKFGLQLPTVTTITTPEGTHLLK